MKGIAVNLNGNGGTKMSNPMILRKDGKSGCFGYVSYLATTQALIKHHESKTGNEASDSDVKSLISSITVYNSKNDHPHGQDELRTFEDVHGRYFRGNEAAFLKGMQRGGKEDADAFLESKAGQKMVSAIYKIFTASQK